MCAARSAPGVPTVWPISGLRRRGSGRGRFTRSARRKVNAGREVRVGELQFPSVAVAARALGLDKWVVARALARGAGPNYARVMDAARAYAAEGGA